MADRLFHAQRLGYSRDYEIMICDWRQVDEPYSIREVVQRICGQLQGKAGFACAAWAGEGYKVHIVPPQQLLQVSQLFLAPDEGCRLGRQIVGAVIERAKWRELRGQTGDDKVIDV